MFKKIKCLFVGHKFTNQRWAHEYSGKMPVGATEYTDMRFVETKSLRMRCACCDKEQKRVEIYTKEPKEVPSEVMRNLIGKFVYGGNNIYTLYYASHPITPEGSAIFLDASLKV